MPNPASTTVTIRTAESNPYNLQLINLLGELVVSRQNLNGEDFIFDVSKLPKGIYIVQIIDTQTNSIGRQKLVVQ